MNTITALNITQVEPLIAREEDFPMQEQGLSLAMEQDERSCSDILIECLSEGRNAINAPFFLP